MPNKIDPRSPELAIWTATMIALVHRSSLATSPCTPNQRREELAKCAVIADEVLELARGRLEGDDERRARERAEDEARHA
jgi:hypothetical protein